MLARCLLVVRLTYSSVVHTHSPERPLVILELLLDLGV